MYRRSQLLAIVLLLAALICLPPVSGSESSKPGQQRLKINMDGTDAVIFYEGHEALVTLKDNTVTYNPAATAEEHKIAQYMLDAHKYLVAGRAKKDERNFKEAADLLTHALELSDKVGYSTAISISSAMNLGSVYLKLGLLGNGVQNGAKAEALFRRCIKEFEQEPVQKEPDRIVFLEFLSQALCVEGKYAEAEKYNRRALEFYKYQNPAIPLGVVQCLNTQALIESGQKKYDAAEKTIQEAIDLIEPKSGPTYISSETAGTLAMLYDLLAETIAHTDHGWKEANARFKALQAVTRVYGPKDSFTLRCLISCARSLVAIDQWSDASDFYRRALEIVDDPSTRDEKLSVQLHKELLACKSHLK